MPLVKKILLLPFCLAFAFSLTAQNASDALRYSYLNFGGTAASMSISNAVGALGGDYGAIAINPAGLAAYRNSILVLTPSFNFVGSKAQLRGDGNNEFNDNKSNLGFSNLGIVLSARPRGRNFTTSNVAIGFNQVANFSETLFFEGSSFGSITDRFLELADGLDISQFSDFEEGIAWDAGAIFPIDVNGVETLVSDFTLDGSNPPVFKNQIVRTTGSINEMHLAWGASIKNKFSVGFSFGLPFVRYEEDKIYKEEDTEDAIKSFELLEYTENVQTSGFGFNLKVGGIYKITQLIRVGASIHTPTRFFLTDNFNTNLIYAYSDAGTIRQNNEASPDGTFEYRLSTPWRVVGSSAFIIKKFGFISADVEWVKYNNANFDFTSGSNSNDFQAAEDEVNSDIDQSFDSAINIKIGAEAAVKKFRIRGGVSLNGSPYAGDGETSLNFSAGVGVHHKKFFMDLGYRHANNEETYIPYNVNVAPRQLVDHKTTTDNLLLTIGFRF